MTDQMRPASVEPPGVDPNQPIDLTVCCQTGDVTVVPLTSSDIQDQQADAAAFNQAQAAQKAQRQQDIATVQASTDPVIQALARLLGL